jgi:hypothetical protein
VRNCLGKTLLPEWVCYAAGFGESRSRAGDVPVVRRVVGVVAQRSEGLFSQFAATEAW